MVDVLLVFAQLLVHLLFSPEVVLLFLDVAVVVFVELLVLRLMMKMFFFAGVLDVVAGLVMRAFLSIS